MEAVYWNGQIFRGCNLNSPFLNPIYIGIVRELCNRATSFCVKTMVQSERDPLGKISNFRRYVVGELYVRGSKSSVILLDTWFIGLLKTFVHTKWAAGRL